MGAHDSGFSGTSRPESTNWEEHGAQGDLSTGRKFKYTQSVPNLIIVDEPDANTTYIGESKPGVGTNEALWRIQKVSISGTVTTFAFADGNDQFVNIWDNRAALSYS